MKKCFLFLFAIGLSLSVQAQTKMNSFVFGFENRTSQTEDGKHVDSFENALNTDIHVHLSKKTDQPPRRLIGAFKGQGGELTSLLREGSKEIIQNFKTGDFLVITIPKESMYFEGDFGGAKVNFNHRVEFEELDVLPIDEDKVRAIFQIKKTTDKSDDILRHIDGHICNPLNPNCL